VDSQDADSTDIYQISRNWKDLVKRARSKQLVPDEYNSGNFTISNLGMFGADTFDAILPPGETPPLCNCPTQLAPPLLGFSTHTETQTRALCQSFVPYDLCRVWFFVSFTISSWA